MATAGTRNIVADLVSGQTAVPEPADFSLVLGGPLYQMWRRSRLAGDALQLLHRRIVVLMVVAWAPLLALSVAQGTAWGGSVALPFLYDIELHVRLLLALPLLVVAELVVHRRMRPVVAQFVQRGLIPDSELTRFRAAVSSAMTPERHCRVGKSRRIHYTWREFSPRSPLL